MALNTSIVVLIAGLAACATLLQGCGSDGNKYKFTCDIPTGGATVTMDCSNGKDGTMTTTFTGTPSMKPDITPVPTCGLMTEATYKKNMCKTDTPTADKPNNKYKFTCDISANGGTGTVTMDCSNGKDGTMTTTITGTKPDITKVPTCGLETEAISKKMCKTDTATADTDDSTCKITDGFECDDLSAGCCKANQAAFQSAADSKQKIKDAGEDADKLKKITDEGNKLHEAAMAACKADESAMKKCKPPWTVMVAEEPQKMLVGICGFLAGAAVMGLATGLKRQQSPQQSQLLG